MEGQSGGQILVGWRFELLVLDEDHLLAVALERVAEFDDQQRILPEIKVVTLKEMTDAVQLECDRI